MIKTKKKIRTLLKERDLERLKSFLQTVDNKYILTILEELKQIGNTEDIAILFRLLPKDTALQVFEMASAPFQEDLVSSLTDETAIELIGTMAPDDRARILDEMPARVAKKLLNSLSKEERQKTTVLLGYAPETAGRIMTPNYTRLKANMTCAEGLEKIRQLQEPRETVYTLYVTDEQRKLQGVLSLRELVQANPESKVKDIMNIDVVHVTTDTDQEEAARLLQERDIIALPVVDRENRLLGIITFDDAMDILEQETTEDIFDKVGLTSLTSRESHRSSRLVSGSFFDVWKVRIPFLIITMIGGLLAGLVIESFEETLEAITALAIFIPVIMDMGGNVGTQSSTIFTRALILGQINMKRFFQHLGREFLVGVSIGGILGLVVALIANLWQGIPGLGQAVGLALFLTITLATTLGFLVPYTLIKLGFDQAAGSDPFITTIKDISALVIYFVLANQFLAYLL